MQYLKSGTYSATFVLNGLEIIALSDGYVDLAASRLRKAGDQPFGSDLPKDIPLYEGKLRLSVNAYLIRFGDELTLIDTGASNAWLPTMGRLFEALDEASISREAIRTVALTHTHEDHVHGLVAPDGSDGFPNLERLLVPAEEIPLFEREVRLERFHGRATPIHDGYAVNDHIVAVAAHGHEIGHTAYEVSAGDANLLIWGDIVHVPSVQFTQPDLTWGADADQDAARETRKEMLKRASAPDVFVAGSHLDFPGVGRVVATDTAYAFEPI
ncbi:MAG: MBL fold metallo-hydrolase [Pseudomonadota bacterium]